MAKRGDEKTNATFGKFAIDIESHPPYAAVHEPGAGKVPPLAFVGAGARAMSISNFRAFENPVVVTGEWQPPSVKERLERAKRIQAAVQASPQRFEIRDRMDAILGPGNHSFEALASAALRAMIEIGDEQLGGLDALLIGEE